MLLRNVSPYGDLDIPLVRRVVQGGTTFEASADQARILLEQPGNYEPVDDEAKGIAAELAAVHEAAEQDAAPPVSAKKAAWVGWAVKNGANADEAEAMTKEQLVAEYGAKGDS